MVEGGTRLSVDDLFTQLKRIVRIAEEEAGSTENVGILTAADRDKWAAARKELRQGV